jgi:hypothetical protein
VEDPAGARSRDLAGGRGQRRFVGHDWEQAGWAKRAVKRGARPRRCRAHGNRRRRGSEQHVGRCRAQACASPRCALARDSRSSLADRAEHLRPPPLAALDLGGSPAARLRSRRADVSALRRPTPSHRGIPFATTPKHPCDSPLRGEPGLTSPTPTSCVSSSRISVTRPSLQGPHSPARAKSSTSSEPPPSRRRARSAPASLRGRIQSARTTAPRGSPASQARPIEA